MSTVTKKPPMPLEWHPAYADKPWLMDWLERRGRYAKLHDIVLPIMPRLTASFNEPKEVATPSFGTMRLTLRKAAGPAPFVGDPRWQRGVYEWNVGTDDQGRSIAGEAHLYIEYDFKPRPPWTHR